MNNKCSCYYEVTYETALTDYEKGLYAGVYGRVPPRTVTVHEGHCKGTRECEPCSCCGDESKCDFYDYKRG